MVNGTRIPEYSYARSLPSGRRTRVHSLLLSDPPACPIMVWNSSVEKKRNKIEYFWSHLRFREVARLIIEVRVIDSHNFREHLAFDLLWKLINRIAIDECTLLAWVGMKVHIKEESSFKWETINNFLHCVDGWLFLMSRYPVVSIQILIIYIHPIVTTMHSVWIQHWDNPESEIFSQQKCSQIILVH